jgi:hypothetical protein
VAPEGRGLIPSSSISPLESLTDGDHGLLSRRRPCGRGMRGPCAVGKVASGIASVLGPLLAEPGRAALQIVENVAPTLTL